MIFNVIFLRELDFHFNIIEVSETRIYNDTGILALNPNIPNYNFGFIPTPLSVGGIGLIVHRRNNELYSF